jgi:hypothetical protein
MEFLVEIQVNLPAETGGDRRSQPSSRRGEGLPARQAMIMPGDLRHDDAPTQRASTADKSWPSLSGCPRVRLTWELTDRRTHGCSDFS